MKSTVELENNFIQAINKFWKPNLISTGLIFKKPKVWRRDFKKSVQ